MIGTTVSHYTILEKLGEGGMGVVYKARDTRLDRCVALKFLPPDLTRDEHAKKRFIREAKAASALDHPNIGVVHDIDETSDGKLFISMACYDGRTLPAPGSGEKLDPEEALRIVIRVAKGLALAHASGIVHRDIKPANIMITSEGEPKILDFGLAKLDRDGVSGSTQTTGGTAAYMSPEQVVGERVDHRTDLFSLGVVLYELVTDRRPFKGEQMPAMMYSIVHTDPKPPTSVRRDLPAGFDRLVLGLLQKDPSHRYQTAGDFCRDAEAVLESRPLAVAPKITSPRRMKKRLAAVGATVSLAITVIVLTWVGTGPPEARRLVVMPFSLLDPAGGSDLTCNGLSVQLTNDLVKLRRDDPRLSITPWQDLDRINVASVRDAASRLGGSYVISGTVDPEGEVVSVFVQLSETQHGSIVGSGDFRKSRGHLSQLSLEMVLAIAGWLEIEISQHTRAELASGWTTDSDAYELYLQGCGYLRHYDDLENVRSAVDAFENAIRLDSTFVRAYTKLTEAFLRRYDRTKEVAWLDAGKEALRKASQIDPLLIDVHISRGLLLAAGGEYEPAIAAFREALSVEPDHPEAFAAMGRAYEHLRDTANASAAFREAIRREPDYWGHYNAYGAYLYRQNRIQEAAGQFARISDIAPENLKGLNNAGSVYLKLNDFASAAEYYRRSLAVERNETALSNLATSYFLQGKFAETVPLYKEAVELRPTNAQLWGNYAESLYWSDGDSVERERAFLKAIELAEQQRTVNPRDEGVLHRLAGYYIKTGDLDRARSVADTAEIYSKGNRYALCRMAITREELGERDRALELIERAVQLGSDLKEVEENFAMEDLRGTDEYKKLWAARKLNN